MGGYKKLNEVMDFGIILHRIPSGETYLFDLSLNLRVIKIKKSFLSFGFGINIIDHVKSIFKPDKESYSEELSSIGYRIDIEELISLRFQKVNNVITGISVSLLLSNIDMKALIQ